ncbi:MAG: dihydroneopterin aldolase [Parachlamydiaceae bacterium]
MLGIIGFEELEIDCVIGVYPDERVATQKLFIDLKVEAFIGDSIHSDRLKDTIDYCELVKLIQNEAESKCQLLETLAHRISMRLLSELNLTWVWIRIKKPSALANAKAALIEYERFKGSNHEVDTHYRRRYSARR